MHPSGEDRTYADSRGVGAPRPCAARARAHSAATTSPCWSTTSPSSSTSSGRPTGSGSTSRRSTGTSPAARRATSSATAGRHARGHRPPRRRRRRMGTTSPRSQRAVGRRPAAGLRGVRRRRGRRRRSPLDDECEGRWMLYSSGTTGKPKGILPPLPEGDLGGPSMITDAHGHVRHDADSVYLSPAPLYHASPAGGPTACSASAARAVVMDGSTRSSCSPRSSATASPTCSRAHDDDPPAQAADEQRPVRPVEPRDGHPRCLAVPGRREAGVHRVGRPDRPRVLQRQRGRRPLLRRPRGLARPPRHGRQVA